MGSADVPSWLTEERLRLYPRAVLLALALAVALTVGLADGAKTVGGTLGGDYAAFHAAGQLVAEGRSAELYQWTAQAAAQEGLHPEEPDRFLAFAYPPFVAVPYAALGRLGFAGGYLAHTVLAAIALIAALQLVRPSLPRAQPYVDALIAVGIGFLPMFRAITGGQNTSFTLLCLAGTWRLLDRRRPVAAGAVAGLLLAKPQFGLPLLGLLSLRHPRALIGAAATAVGLYALGAAVGGPNWIPWWWDQIGAFHEMDQGINASNSVGMLGWVEAWIGPGHPVALGVGGVLSGVLVVGLMALWWRDTEVTTRWGLTAVGLVLVPPHSMSYDAGLAVLALWVWVDRVAQGRGSPYGPAAAWLAALTAPLSAWLGVNPLLPVVVALGVGVWLTRARSTG